MKVIGVAGTAKNTGKTTTLVALLAEAARSGLQVAVTSIGYDGESHDHLTGLPKPRVDLPAGALVATAEKLTYVGSARLELIKRTGALTPLGEVVVARCTAPGRAVLAGPSSGGSLRRVLEVMAPLGADLCLVDGAFGRMAPMLETDGLVLATGAARQRELPLLLAETAALAWFFQMKVIGDARRHTEIVASLLTAADGARLAQDLVQITGDYGGTRIEVLGAVADAALTILAEAADTWPNRVGFRFADPVKLALAGAPLHTRAMLRRLGRRGPIGVARALPLLGVTVNPFYPEPHGQGYRAKYTDPILLEDEMARAVPVPVGNLMSKRPEAGPDVIQAILRQAVGQAAPGTPDRV